jgi:hypothetical protein
VGAKRQSSWFWGDGDRANVASYNPETQQGFITLLDREFERRELADYKRDLADDASWKRLEVHLNKYFNHLLDPFPYDRPGQDGAKPESQTVVEDGDPWSRRMLSMIAGFRFPADFFQTHLDMIVRRFPAGSETKPPGSPSEAIARSDSAAPSTPGAGGANDDALAKGPHATLGVDADIRGYISALRYVYGWNLWRLILRRRVHATIASLLTLVSFVLVAWVARAELEDLPFQLSARSIVGGGVVALTFIYVFWWISNYPALTSSFMKSIETSCANVGRGVERRFAYLRTMSRQLHDEIPKRDSYPRKTDWPIGAKNWAKLALWMSMRAQHLEYFFQVEMWRIRRMEAWIRFIGYVMTSITLLAGLATLIVGGAVLAWGADAKVIGVTVGAGLIAFYALQHVNRVVFRKKRTGRDILGRNLNLSIERGSGDAKLHELSADTYSTLIQDVLYVESFGAQRA